MPDFVGYPDGPPEHRDDPTPSGEPGPPPGSYPNTSGEPGQRDGRAFLIAGIAAGVGILIGCTGTWVSLTSMFSIGGLDASRWGKVGVGIGARR